MNRRAVFFALVVAVLLPLSACGKKGPPVPPSSPAPPGIAGLKITLDETRMTLTWRVVSTEEESTAPPAGFFVYRSRLDLSGDCRDCPPQFEKTAEIPVVNAQIRTTYTELLDEGFRYVYKVSSYTDSGLEGEASAPVAVEFPVPEENGRNP